VVIEICTRVINTPGVGLESRGLNLVLGDNFRPRMRASKLFAPEGPKSSSCRQREF
jgi:hypothetical protein